MQVKQQMEKLRQQKHHGLAAYSGKRWYLPGQQFWGPH